MGFHNSEVFKRSVEQEPRLAEKVRILDVARVLLPEQQAAIRACLTLCKSLVELHIGDVAILSSRKTLMTGSQILRIGIGTRWPSGAAYYAMIQSDLPLRAFSSVELNFECYWRFIDRKTPVAQNGIRKPAGKLRAETLVLGNVGCGKEISSSEFMRDAEKTGRMRVDDALAGKVLDRFIAPQQLHLVSCVFTDFTFPRLLVNLSSNVTHLRLSRVQVFTIEEMVRDFDPYNPPAHMRPAHSLTFALSGFSNLKVLELGSVLPTVSAPPPTLQAIRLLELSSNIVKNLHTLLTSHDLPVNLRLSLSGQKEAEWESDCEQRDVRLKLAEKLDELCVVRDIRSEIGSFREICDERDNRHSRSKGA